MVQTVHEVFSPVPPLQNSLRVSGLQNVAQGLSVVSDVIDNYNSGLNLFPEIIIQASITTGGSGTFTSGGYVEVSVQASLDNVNFPGLIGSAANDIPLAVIKVTANSQTYPVTFAMSPALNGVIAPYNKLRFFNFTGSTISAYSVGYCSETNTLG